MSRLSFAFATLGIFLATSGCNLPAGEEPTPLPDPGVPVPSPVLDFIAVHYGGRPIESVRQEEVCDTPVYEVALDPAAGPDVDLCFDLDWNFLFQATDIPDSALPAAVLSSIQSLFLGYSLVPGDAERFDFPDGQVQYEVSLAEPDETALEVLWYADGTVACLEQD